MPVRTRRFAIGRQNGAGTVTAYVVPADRTAILKQVQLHNNSGTNGAVVQLAVVPSGQANPRVMQRWDLAPLTGTGSVPYWLVLLEGDTIQIIVGAGDVHYALSGTLLLGDPA